MPAKIKTEVNDARVSELQRFLSAAFNGNKAQLGRRLGHRDGSYIGQLLRFERPIKEDTWAAICTLHEVKPHIRPSTPAFGLAPAIPNANDPHLGGQDQPSVAQRVSQRIPIVTPQTLIWGAFVLSDIQGEFIMAIAGDALAPHYLPGELVVWEACDFGKPGKAVLLVDQSGTFELRIYEPRGGGAWAGVSSRPGHRELTPEKDGVRIVARSKWRSED